MIPQRSPFYFYLTTEARGWFLVVHYNTLGVLVTLRVEDKLSTQVAGMIGVSAAHLSDVKWNNNN